MPSANRSTTIQAKAANAANDLLVTQHGQSCESSLDASWARERFGVRQCLGAFDLAITLGHKKAPRHWRTPKRSRVYGHLFSIQTQMVLWSIQQTSSLISVVAAPRPNESICERLLENLAVAMTGSPAEHVSVVVTFGLEGVRGAIARHHPIVISFFRILRP